MELTLKFSASPEAVKTARMFLAFDRAMAWFSGREWDAPVNRQEFNYQDDQLYMVSYWSGDIRVSIWRDHATASLNFILDAMDRAGKRVTGIGEFGALGRDDWFIAHLDEQIVHSIDQNMDHRFEQSSAAFVREYLHHSTTPWLNHPVETANRLQPLSSGFVKALARLGYRSTGINTWAGPGDNTGRIQ
ncbi:MAG: hypothetical protein EOS75_05320 [Mesorhizobium sp.]|nr:MAG: hypothetical protein EOS74_29185 [Mesorhizobium sp.]RWD59125.1 MAG: hypothetical protein EOS75_05320 [Mesorhizobium sp.]